MSAFGPRLRELRESAGLSQKALADKAKLSQSAVAHWEQGLRAPSWENVLTLCNALGVSCEEFSRPAANPVKKRPRGRTKKAEGK